MTAVDEIFAGIPEIATITLLILFALIVLQEAVNGFHANAVATVNYSNSMRPVHAISMAALMNFFRRALRGNRRRLLHRLPAADGHDRGDQRRARGVADAGGRPRDPTGRSAFGPGRPAALRTSP